MIVDRDVVEPWVIKWDAEHSAADPECEVCQVDTEPMYVEQAAAVIAGFEAALWSGTVTDDEGGGESFQDAGYEVGDISVDAAREFARDVAEFWHDNAGDLLGLDPAQVGHDFVLTRNRHGAGFWDRGLGDVGDRLTDQCHSYGGWDLYVGDDGKLHA